MNDKNVELHLIDFTTQTLYYSCAAYRSCVINNLLGSQ